MSFETVVYVSMRVCTMHINTFRSLISFKETSESFCFFDCKSFVVQVGTFTQYHESAHSCETSLNSVFIFTSRRAAHIDVLTFINHIITKEHFNISPPVWSVKVHIFTK